MKGIIRYQTSVGTFLIAQSSDGRFHPVFNDEDLGSYTSVHHAVDDLVNNATFSVLHPQTSQMLDTSTLGLPENPGEWEKIIR